MVVENMHFTVWAVFRDKWEVRIVISLLLLGINMYSLHRNWMYSSQNICFSKVSEYTLFKRDMIINEIRNTENYNRVKKTFQKASKASWQEESRSCRDHWHGMMTSEKWHPWGLASLMTFWLQAQTYTNRVYQKAQSAPIRRKITLEQVLSTYRISLTQV